MKLNPHGDAAIYDTMVRLATGKRGAAALRLSTPRATSARSTPGIWPTLRPGTPRPSWMPICAELFRDIDQDTVDLVDNYDATMKEPTLLPTTFPNVLVTSQHRASPWAWPATSAALTLQEVCKTAIALDEGPVPAICWRRYQAPDFTTGGGRFSTTAQEMAEIYRTGRGSFQIRARWRYRKAGQSALKSPRSPIRPRRRPLWTRSTDLVKAGQDPRDQRHARRDGP